MPTNVCCCDSAGGYDSPNGNNRYTLFAVINHIGNIEAGHYTSYVRQHRDRWYRCNDHQIVPATIKEVLTCLVNVCSLID